MRSGEAGQSQLLHSALELVGCPKLDEHLVGVLFVVVGHIWAQTGSMFPVWHASGRAVK